MTGPQTKTRAHQARPHQIVAASEWLAKHATILERNSQGYPTKCRYANGSDDKTMADHIGITESQAKRLRFRLYGELVTPPKKRVQPKDLAASLAALTEVVADLATTLGAVEIAERARAIGVRK